MFLVVTFVIVSLSTMATGTTIEYKKDDLCLTGPYIHGGSMHIEGPCEDPTVWCSAKNNLLIPVGRDGSVVTLYVDYYMDCPGMADDGFCEINFVGTSISDSAETGEHLEGRLEISKFFYPGRTVAWKLHAIYWNWWKTKVIGEDTDFGGGRTIRVVDYLLEITTTSDELEDFYGAESDREASEVVNIPSNPCNSD